jgi:hypothetical protein
MKMHDKRTVIIVIISLIGGVLVTWLTGFFRPLFPFMTVDVLEWGSPFPYLTRVVTFRGPAFINWETAAIDFIIWTIIIFIVLFLVCLYRSPDRVGQAKK